MTVCFNPSRTGINEGTQPETFTLVDSSMCQDTIAPSGESNFQPATSNTNLPPRRAFPSTSAQVPFDLDRILGNGIFQWLIVAFTHVSATLVIMHHMSAQTFLIPVDHWCRPPRGANISVDQWKEKSIPRRPDGSYSQCSMYDPVALERNGTRVEVACDEWEYDLLPGATTIVSQWNLVCDRAWYVTVAFVYNRVGVVIMVLFFGQISDRIGRLPAVYICTVISVASAGTSMVAQTFLEFVVARILLAASLSVLDMAMVVVLFESSGDKYKERYFCLVMTAVSVASLIAQGLSLASTDYRAVNLVSFFLTFALLPGLCLLNESLCWLLVSNNTDQAERVVQRAAAWNHHQVDGESLFFTVSSFPASSLLPRMNCVSFLTTREIRKRTSALCWIWFNLMLALYGMGLTGRPSSVWHAAFLAVMRTASVILTWMLLSASARKSLLSLALPLTCCLVLLYGCLRPLDEGGLTWVVGEIIMCTLLGEAMIVVIFTLELYPTVVRCTGSSFTYFCGQLGATLGPLLSQLQLQVSPTAASLLCFLMIFSAIFSIRLLPETKHRMMLQTLEDLGP
ncbi:hypothetical protein V5799_030790 [Amblyomma americanum]|uniref:Uncharacterized protein n=1 Tax=Amblyomma americanum TaxID=6943 RepID=A0AAQ4EM60_AMBAM